MIHIISEQSETVGNVGKEDLSTNETKIRK